MTSDLVHSNPGRDRLNKPPDRRRVSTTRRIGERNLVAAHLDHLLRDVRHPLRRDGTLKGALYRRSQAGADAKAEFERWEDDIPHLLDPRSDLAIERRDGKGLGTKRRTSVSACLRQPPYPRSMFLTSVHPT